MRNNEEQRTKSGKTSGIKGFLYFFISLVVFDVGQESFRAYPMVERRLLEYLLIFIFVVIPILYALQVKHNWILKKEEEEKKNR